MSRRTSVLLVATWLAVPGLALAEEELTPEKVAAIHRDEQAAKAKVDAAYGNRKPSEMTNEERAQAAKDQQAAGLSVMEKHGVSDKEYSRHVATMPPEEREAVARAEKKQEADEKAAKEAKESEQKKDDEGSSGEDIPIQQGISDEHPVEMESSGDASSVVEQGLPPGEQASDEAPAMDGADAAQEAAPAAPAAPAAHSKKSSKRK
jgi:hypothetical protein